VSPSPKIGDPSDHGPSSCLVSPWSYSSLTFSVPFLFGELFGHESLPPPLQVFPFGSAIFPVFPPPCYIKGFSDCRDKDRALGSAPFFFPAPIPKASFLALFPEAGTVLRFFVNVSVLGDPLCVGAAPFVSSPLSSGNYNPAVIL